MLSSTTLTLAYTIISTTATPETMTTDLLLTGTSTALQTNLGTGLGSGVVLGVQMATGTFIENMILMMTVSFFYSRRTSNNHPPSDYCRVILIFLVTNISPTTAPTQTPVSVSSSSTKKSNVNYNLLGLLVLIVIPIAAVALYCMRGKTLFQQNTSKV